MGIDANRRRESRVEPQAPRRPRARCSTAPASCSPRRATRGWSCATSPSAARRRAARSTTTSPAARASSRPRRPSWRASEIRDPIERSLGERGLQRDADDVRRDLPPPRRRPPRADRLPGRRRGPRPPRGPGARRRRHRRLPELGSSRSPRRCATKGVGAATAETFAGLVVSTIEGALLRARAAGDQAPLDSAVAGLDQALDALRRHRVGNPLPLLPCRGRQSACASRPSKPEESAPFQ